MPLTLPNSLFVANRITKVGDHDFRLSTSFRAALLHGSEVPLPTALALGGHSPIHDLPHLVVHLHRLLHHYLRLGHAQTMVATLADVVIQGVQGNPDGYLAAMWMLPHDGMYTARHALHCAIMAALAGETLDFEAQVTHELVCAALTMNVGAASLHDEMNRQEGPPSTLQRQWLDMHPLVSAAMLRESGIDDGVWHHAVLFHHERTDHGGYPFHLGSDDLPEHARLLRLLDSLNAKLMPRDYRARMSVKKALGGTYGSQNEALESQLAAILIKRIGFYPPGSFVELSNGERALVVQPSLNAGEPRVVVEHGSREVIETGGTGLSVIKSIPVAIDAARAARFADFWRNSHSVQST